MKRLLQLPWYWATLFVVILTGVAFVVFAVLVRVVFAPRVTVDGEPLTWVDWTSVVGLPLAVIGIVAAFIQILRVGSSAEAARAAVDQALTALSKHELLVDLQTMRQLEYDRSMATGADRDTVNRWIREVREVSGRVVATLRNSDDHDPLIPEIEAVREAASEARLVIMGGRANLNVWTVTRKLREELVPTCDKIATRMNEMRLDVRREEENDVG